jgi:tetratricopeptide (TPR) repeat protein
VLIESLIVDLSHDPFNAELNFRAAVEYQHLNQTASAISFYLRTAEYGKDTHPSLAYASLLKLAECFEHQNDRLHTVSNALLQAIAYLPYRPEGYFLMARYHERQQNWQECYTWAQIGLYESMLPINPLDVDVEYVEYGLAFEKAVSGWWVGRKDESILLFNQLLEKDLTPEYRQAVENNLARIV